MIAAACVLHNFIIINDELNIQEDYYFNEENIEIEENNIMHEEVIIEAVEKRTLIVELF